MVIIIGALQNPRLASKTGVIVDQLTDLALATLAREASCAPEVLRFLLRRYGATGQSDLEGALGPGLADALTTRPWIADPSETAEWLWLFVEASRLSDDEHVLDAAMNLAGDLARAWPAERQTPTAAALRAVDVCLLASDVCPHEEDARHFITAAIDELERVVVPLYRPGEGIGRERSDHVAAASALLAAYERTGRLPYSMLAEELMRFVLLTWPAAREPLVVSSRAIPVFGRLAELQEDPAYLEAAMPAPGVSYAHEAEALVEALADGDDVLGDISTAMEYGLALCDWLSHERLEAGGWRLGAGG